MRPFDNKYAKLALAIVLARRQEVTKKVGRFALAETAWALADFLESQDAGKHEQHLLQIGVRWINALDERPQSESRKP